jgi:hypothetical protein
MPPPIRCPPNSAAGDGDEKPFYFDELYEATFIRAHDFIAAVRMD